MNKQTRKITLMVSFFTVMMAVAVVPATATITIPNNHDLKITSERITLLQNANWLIFDYSNGNPRYYLKWITPDLHFAHQQLYPLTNKQPGYETGRPDGQAIGDCACFAEAAIAPNYATSNVYLTKDFRKGRKVMDYSNYLIVPFWKGISPGTVIATYPLDVKENGSYVSSKKCHIAVFADWNDTGRSGSILYRKCDGFWVWDQHDYSDGNGDYYPFIGKHLIKDGGAILTSEGTINNGNASNWYVVHPPY